ncbi:glycine cleavage system aminomethyltransferase GcvT [Lysinibacter sp. HNR]|uniref:glycine cleavage system aminomethyltransferase GcvT n=1 Tax=Lysinibacter sp. HNR TaxID=3031408 RepID=UPI0024358A96|nr:glycine cleavage system aminomethyltransferase GcvT [Lysinibacter sp. HNR]WGD38347.1 glycine cleavage system aminomethyltransferase GcvT [Lysinibacter sp. HNR]
MSERLSPLHPIHEQAEATFTDFAGWQMPVRYTSDLAEHHAVREAAGIFDISHMAEITVSGADAAAFLDYALAGKLSATKVGQAKYSLLLSERGTVIDDLIVYRLSEDNYFVVANAGNRHAAVEALVTRAAQFSFVEVSDRSDEYVLVAVQGPRALTILQETSGLAPEESLDSLRYYWSTGATFNGRDVLIGRTGYTGEDGFEIYAHTDDAAALWNAVMAAGAQHGLVPAGLACRDTLRLEAGMPLYGHELSLNVFPVQAGLGRVVALSKEGDFVGREGTEAGPADNARVLVGLVSDGKRAARADYPVFTHAESARAIGVITSGALSPTLGYPIAMAYVDPQFTQPGTELSVDIRGKRLGFTVSTLPFYTREKK